MEVLAKQVYFAGALFTQQELMGNVFLAEAINRLSEGRYHCKLPQDLETPDIRGNRVRNNDLKHVITADACIFHFDGTELDSGTVVEHDTACFADIPSVVVRSDFRKGGDLGSDPWNLMVSGYPRARVSMVNSIVLYQKHRLIKNDNGQTIGLRSAPEMLEPFYNELAIQIIHGLDTACAIPPRLNADEAEVVYKWLFRFPGDDMAEDCQEVNLASLLARKRALGLMSTARRPKSESSLQEPLRAKVTLESPRAIHEAICDGLRLVGHEPTGLNVTTHFNEIERIDARTSATRIRLSATVKSCGKEIRLSRDDVDSMIGFSLTRRGFPPVSQVWYTYVPRVGLYSAICTLELC